MKTGNCPIHRGAGHDEENCNVLKKHVNSALARQASSQASSSRSTTFTPRSYPPAIRMQPVHRANNMCWHCNKVPFVPGHECPEMRQARARRAQRIGNNNIRSRMARLSDTTTMMEVDESQLDKQAQGKLRSFLSSRSSSNSIFVPITLQNKQVRALVDTGSDHSLIDIEFAKDNKWPIIAHTHPGSIITSLKGHVGQRYGKINDIPIKYAGHQYTHTFEVLPLSENIKVIIGLDLMPTLGISIHGLATNWDIDDRLPKVPDENLFDIPKPNESPAGNNTEQQTFHAAIKPYIEANTKIPKSSFCNVKQSIVRLETPPGVTSHRPQYPLAEAAMDEVRATIHEWLADGVIEPAPTYSAWNSPLTLAEKKDPQGKKTKLRLCLDPRHINELLPDNRYPLPLIKQIFHTLKGAAVYTTLDLKSAFHRFMIREEDRHKLQFSILGRQYRWVGAPFGLKVLPSIFQATMASLFNHLPFVQCFIDDIVIFSKDMHEHIDHVQQVINILTNANLILNPEKCHFAQQSVYLLGFCVSQKGIALDPRKVTNVQTWPRPKTGKDIMKFLGVITYFSDWIPNLTKLTAPLNKLRNADSLDGLWHDTHEYSFETLKAILLKAPILRYPNMKYPFYVATDASNVGIGAVLYQIIDGETRHISFVAKSLNDAQRKYTTTKKELLAIIYALKQFHQYLWGRHFTLYTDHRALVYLHTQRVANSMLVNWLDILLEYDFTVVHLPGLENTLPDALSRLFPAESTLAGDDDADIVTENNKRKRTGQKGNTKRRRVDTRHIRAKATHLSVTLPYADMLTPPEGERKDLLIKKHALGHFGAEAITRSLHSDGIHWNSMQKEAVELVRQCPECQINNIVRHGYHPLRPIHVYIPGDQWAIDLAGPFRPSFLNNNYIMVMVDVCTRFCIIRPLPNKQSDTIVRELITQFCTFGFPRYLQSDNGKEFVNSLIEKLAQATGFDQRLTTPYHPRANGVAERYVQTTVRTLKKSIRGAAKDWDIFLPAVQLAINSKITKRHNTAPFNLMFARKMNAFKDYREEKGLPPVSPNEWQQRIHEMETIVFPAISERVQAVIKAQKDQFDRKHYIVDFKEGDIVNVKVRERKGKLDSTEYEGPYTIVHKTKGGSYVLKNSNGDIEPRNYQPSVLKLISQDEVIPCDELYVVESILAHKEIKPGVYHYKVRWKGYDESDDTWEPEENFSQRQTILDYWSKLQKTDQPEKASK